METMRIIKSVILLVSVLISNLLCQEYDVSLWGIPIGSGKINNDIIGEMSMELKTIPLIENIYPIHINYFSKYDKSNYTIIENSKSANQGKDKQDFKALLGPDNVLNYDDAESVVVNENTHSLISLIVRLLDSSIEAIDTKWFNLENEGILYKARFLWNDTVTVVINNKGVFSDHYRIDLEIVDDSKKIFETTDYFNEVFFDINSIRQIWVEQWQKQKRLAKISIKSSSIKLDVAITN